MKYNTSKTIDVDDYIAGFPAEMQRLLQQVKATIIKAAPDAQEVISYQMPAYKYHDMLVYFAGYKNHIGFYPTASGIATFKQEISFFNNSKSAGQFPIERLMPLELVTKIVVFRTNENVKKAAIRENKKI